MKIEITQRGYSQACQPCKPRSEWAKGCGPQSVELVDKPMVTHTFDKDLNWRERLRALFVGKMRYNAVAENVLEEMSK